MIHFCTCTKRSASAIKLSKSRKGSKSCKSCGSKFSVDGRRSLSESMLSTVGLELSSAIDPHLNWKTATKCRSSSVRRARTSFSGVNKLNSIAESLKVSEDSTEKDTKKTRDMQVSESEKFGVSILGRRFSDSLESVPIKKRRLLFIGSPSPSHESPCHFNDSYHIFESQSASYHWIAAKEAQQVREIKSGIRLEFDQEGRDDVEHTNMEEINENLYDNADFSGISILAAAACNSHIACEMLSAEGSVLKGHSFEGDGFSGAPREAELNSASSGREEHELTTSQDLDGRTDLFTAAILASKQSDQVESDGSVKQEEDITSLQDEPNKTCRVGSSSLSDRIHWDLNTVMDAWEGNCGEVLTNSEPLASDIVVVGNQDKGLDNVELCDGELWYGDSKDASEVVNTRVCLPNNCSLEQSKVLDGSDHPADNSVADYRERKECFTLSPGDVSAIVVQHLKANPVASMLDALKEKNALHTQGDNLDTDVSGLLEGVQGMLKDSMADGSAINEEKSDAKESHGMEAAKFISENAILDHHSVGKPYPGVAQSIAGIFTEEKACVASVADLDTYSPGCCLTNDPTSEATCFRSLSEEHASLCNDDPGTGKTSQYQLQEGSNVQVDGNFCKTNMNGGGIFGKDVHSVPLDRSASDCTEKFEEVNASCCPSDYHAFNSQGLSNHDELPSGSVCVGEYETSATDISIQVNNGHDTATDTSSVPMGTMGNLVNKKKSIIDAPSLEGVLSSHVAHKSFPGEPEMISHDVVSDNHFDSDNRCNASHTDADQVGMQRVELEEDDYQYEDGEFRESLVYGWGGERETEHGNCGLDNREINAFEAAHDSLATSLQPGGSECKNQSQLDAVGDLHDEKLVANKVIQESASQTLMKTSSIIHGSDAELGRSSFETCSWKTAVGHSTINENQNLVRNMKDVAKSGGVRDLCRTGNLRMKPSGWDCLPEGCRSSGDRPGESLIRVVRSPQRRGLSSQIERPESSDMSCRKDRSCVRASRIDDRYDLVEEDERDDHTSRPIRREGSSLHGRGRVRSDQWMGSSNDWHPGCHESPGQHGPGGFTYTGSKSAVAATIAKLESNGFVVSPDGTIIKAGVSRRSENASSRNMHHSPMRRVSPVRRNGANVMPLGLRNSTQMSLKRDVDSGRRRAGGYGPRLASPGPRERCRRPLHDGSRGGRSFSPQKRSSSPSRSRTRSPHMWASPRERNDGRMHGGLGLHRRSRSPLDFKSESRLDRMRLPHQRLGFMDRMIRYSPPPKRRTSPLRWMDERKHEYARSPVQSPTKRVFSQYQRFDSVNSQRKMKPDEYRHPTHSGRLNEVVDKVKVSRHGGTGDGRKGHSHNYKMLNSVREYDTDGNTKHFSYGDEDGFRTRNP